MNDSQFHFLCVFFGVQRSLDPYHHSFNVRYSRIDLTMSLKQNIPRAVSSNVNKKTLFKKKKFPQLQLKEFMTEVKTQAL